MRAAFRFFAERFYFDLEIAKQSKDCKMKHVRLDEEEI